MATTKATATKADTPQFEILTEAPQFRSGKEKSALRLAMENLEVGQSMTTGVIVSGETPATQEDKNAIASVRQKAIEINKARNMKGLFSVKVDVQNRVIVSRNEGRAADAPGTADDSDV
jgi:hypothetical protein